MRRTGRSIILITIAEVQWAKRHTRIRGNSTTTQDYLFGTVRRVVNEREAARTCADCSRSKGQRDSTGSTNSQVRWASVCLCKVVCIQTLHLNIAKREYSSSRVSNRDSLRLASCINSLVAKTQIACTEIDS